MRNIEICEKIAPYSQSPGTECLVPCSDWVITAFPAMLKVAGLPDIPIGISGPVQEFLVQMDLERDCVWISGRALNGYYRLQLKAQKEGLFLTVHKAPKLGIEIRGHHLAVKDKVLLASGGRVSLRAACERLSLGSWKAQDWDLVRRRSDLREIIPPLFLLGQKTPVVPFSEEGTSRATCKIQGSSILGIILAYFRFFFGGLYTNVDITPRKRIENRLKRTRKSTEPDFCKWLSSLLDGKMDVLFRSAFSGILVPRLEDPLHQGIFERPSIAGDPLAILGLAYRKIRAHLIQEEGSSIRILPGIKEYPVGRASLQASFGLVHLEWTQGIIRKMIVEPLESCEVAFVFQKEVVSFRFCGQRVDNGAVLSLQAGAQILFDRFQK